MTHGDDILGRDLNDPILYVYHTSSQVSWYTLREYMVKITFQSFMIDSGLSQIVYNSSNH